MAQIFTSNLNHKQQQLNQSHMKNFTLAFALFLSVAGSSFAGTNTTAVISKARELTVVLELNEWQYLKVRNLMNARLEEEKAGRASMQEINEKFTAAMFDELTIPQQKSFKGYLASNTAFSLAVLTK
jgi:hypothetical protein